MFKTIGIALFVVGVLLAQDGGEKTTVPLHDPSRPGRVETHLMSGSIIVHGANVKDVIVEARSRRREELHERRPARADGMKRLDLAGTGLDVVEDNNVVHIQTSSWTTPKSSAVLLPQGGVAHPANHPRLCQPRTGDHTVVRTGPLSHALESPKLNSKHRILDCWRLNRSRTNRNTNRSIAGIAFDSSP